MPHCPIPPSFVIQEHINNQHSHHQILLEECQLHHSHHSPVLLWPSCFPVLIFRTVGVEMCLEIFLKYTHSAVLGTRLESVFTRIDMVQRVQISVNICASITFEFESLQLFLHKPMHFHKFNSIWAQTSIWAVKIIPGNPWINTFSAE